MTRELDHWKEIKEKIYYKLNNSNMYGPDCNIMHTVLYPLNSN